MSSDTPWCNSQKYHTGITEVFLKCAHLMWEWSEIVISILCRRWQTRIERCFTLTLILWAPLAPTPPPVPKFLSAEQPRLCLCAPSTEIRTSSGTTNQPSFHALSFPHLPFVIIFYFIFKALFPSQFSKFPAEKLTGDPSEGIGEGGIAGAVTSLPVQVFTLPSPPLCRNSKADLEHRVCSSQSWNSTFFGFFFV